MVIAALAALYGGKWMKNRCRVAVGGIGGLSESGDSARILNF